VVIITRKEEVMKILITEIKTTPKKVEVYNLNNAFDSAMFWFKYMARRFERGL
jgi:hypothetical protein